MEEPMFPPEPPPKAAPPRATSLAARLLNVFAVPGAVFEEVKAGPMRVTNWLLPAVLWALVASVAALVLFSQPAIQQKMRDNQTKMFAKQVQAGTVTPADAARSQAVFDKLAVPLLVGMVVSFSFLRLFWWAFVLWVFGRLFLKAQFGYVKTLEIAGLAIMISVLGVLVVLLLSVDLGQVFSHPGLPPAASSVALARRGLLIDGAVSLFSVWLLGVMSVGLARLAGVPFLRAAWLAFAYWVLQQSLFLMLGLDKLAL